MNSQNKSNPILLKNIFYAIYVKMRKKNIIISKSLIKIINKILYINFDIFTYIKKYLKKKRKLKNFFYKKILYSQVFFAPYKYNIILITINNLNVTINKRQLFSIYLALKDQQKKLFNKRIGLFYDFLLQTILIINKNLSIFEYLHFQTLIFSTLKKRMHNKYLFFIKNLCLLCINTNQKFSLIKGLKFAMHGRLKGKSRSNKFKILTGTVPCLTLSSNIIFSKIHAFTRYGTFGIKLWVNYSKCYAH